MQELLESLQKDYDGLNKQKTQTSGIFKIAVATVMKNIEDLYLSKEKNQIMEAYQSGRDNEWKAAQDYFNETFKK